MKAARESLDTSVVASLSRHLAFSPVAFAVTEGPAHVLRYANDAFRRLEADGEVSIGSVLSRGLHTTTDLTPLLDRAFRGGETLRDELLSPAENAAPRWSCTVWPISPATAAPEGVVIEVRDTSYIEGARSKQRAIAERLLIGALRDQDTAREAIEESRRTAFLSAASRELAMSLDPEATREVIRRRTLPREGTWCIVDLIEANGVIHRLAVVHPDPTKQALARTLADHWYPRPGDPTRTAGDSRPSADPVVLTTASGAALLAAAHGAQNLSTLRALGFGTLLVVPLIVHARVLGSITFVTSEGDAPFAPQEIALASDLADRCAMALDNARLYRETDVLRAAADVASRAKSEFLGNMSHELRTPLNVIGGYAELMEMGLRGPITEEQRADLVRIKESQRHLLTLISEILNFVRNETGRLEYHFHAVAVGVAIREVAQMLDGAVKERHLTLVQLPDNADPLAWADANRVRQILTNLVMNAVKYTPVGGGAITLSSAVVGDTVRVEVADTGHGIPRDKLEAIFEPFVQLTSGLTERQGGVGLGLAISRDLARAMMGDLTVESTVGVGSRFTLTLPRAPSDSKKT